MDASRYPAASRERMQAADAPPPRAVPPILDRFRALLRDREEELRSEDPRPFVAEDVVPLYEEVLAELTFNSKPMITELTMIADEQQEHAAGIADAICSRILDVPVDQKLPCLYLLDSIVKNVGNEYLRHFSVRLPEVFCEAYYQVPPNIRTSMRHLFGTWLSVFSSSVRRKIQNELQFSPERRRSSGYGNTRNSESPSRHPAHGIHVNPKYLEARNNFDHLVNVNKWERDPHIRTNESYFGDDLAEKQMAEISKKWSGGSPNYHDTRPPREPFPMLDTYEHKTLSQLEDYNLDKPDAVGKSGGLRGGSKQLAIGHGSSLIDSKNNHRRHPSPNASFGRLGNRNPWQEKKLLDNDLQQTEAHISYDISSDLNAIRSRELIDAYGNSKGKSTISFKPPKLQRLDSNGINPESAMKNWQSSEEEEYVWEDMSPTLAHRSKNSRLMPFDVNFKSPATGAHLKKPDALILDPDFRSNWSVRTLSPHDGPSPVLENDRSFLPEFVSGSIHGGPQTNVVHHQNQISHLSHDNWKSRYTTQESARLNLSPRLQGSILHPSLSTADVAAVGHMPLPSAPRKTDLGFENLPGSRAEALKSENLPPLPTLVTAEKLLGQGPASAHIVPSTTWPSVHKSHPLSSMFASSQNRQFTERIGGTGTGRSTQGIDLPFSLPWHPSDTFDRRMPSSGTVIPSSIQNASLAPINSNNQSSVSLQFPHHDLQGSIAAPVKMQVPYPISHSSTQAHTIFPTSAYPKPFHLQPPPFLAPRIPDNSFQMPSGPLPPLPPGPPPTMPRTGIFGGSMSSTTPSTMPSGFSGLINSLVSQGVISLMPQNTSQDDIGIEFNPDDLKVRHESAINDLYANLPRQCTTCGLRFKCQEEHSSHMDWHVTKNRTSKNHKQKSSRKWFVTSKEWLSGAETVGVDAVPGFLPMEAVVDTHEEKELAVPADDNQKLCALCGEPFEDFYSDEADEWMYKGSVYLNAPEGYVGGTGMLQLGPIVHAKCRSESTGMQGKP